MDIFCCHSLSLLVCLQVCDGYYSTGSISLQWYNQGESGPLQSGIGSVHTELLRVASGSIAENL